MAKQYSSTPDILSATWGLLVPDGHDIYEFQLPLMSPKRAPSGIKTHYLLFVSGSTIGGVVEVETSVTPGAISRGAYVKFLFPVLPLAAQTAGVPLEDRRFWAGLVEAHEATMLRSVAEGLTGKSWENVTTRDAQARR